MKAYAAKDIGGVHSPMTARRFESGRVCLDLVAADTELDSIRGLLTWVYEAELVPSGTEVGASKAWLRSFTTLRALLERMVRAELLGAVQTAQDVAALNEAARHATPTPAAIPGKAGTLMKGLTAIPGCKELMAAVARDAVELLTDPFARSQLKQCEEENCPRVYLDTSRARGRRWCSSETCGNRVRVARHRNRSATTPALQ